MSSLPSRVMGGPAGEPPADAIAIWCCCFWSSWVQLFLAGADASRDRDLQTLPVTVFVSDVTYRVCSRGVEIARLCPDGGTFGDLGRG